MRNDNFKTLGSYLWSVFAIGQIVENLLAYLRFFSNSFCIVIYVCCFPVFTVSEWYQDYLKREKVASKTRTICCLYPFLKIHLIYAESGVVPLETEIEAPKTEVMDHNNSQQVFYTQSDQAPQQPGYYVTQQQQPVMYVQQQVFYSQSDQAPQQPGYYVTQLQQPVMYVQQQQQSVMYVQQQQQPVMYVQQQQLSPQDASYDALRSMITSSNAPAMPH